MGITPHRGKECRATSPWSEQRAECCRDVELWIGGKRVLDGGSQGHPATKRGSEGEFALLKPADAELTARAAHFEPDRQGVEVQPIGCAFTKPDTHEVVNWPVGPQVTRPGL